MSDLTYDETDPVVQWLNRRSKPVAFAAVGGIYLLDLIHAIWWHSWNIILGRTFLGKCLRILIISFVMLSLYGTYEHHKEKHQDAQSVITQQASDVEYAQHVRSRIANGAVITDGAELAQVTDENGEILLDAKLAGYHQENAELLFAETVEGIRKKLNVPIDSKTAYKNAYQFFCFKQAAESGNCYKDERGNWHVISETGAHSTMQWIESTAEEVVGFRLDGYIAKLNLTADISQLKRVEENGAAVYGLNYYYQYSMALMYLYSWSEIYPKMGPGNIQSRKRVQGLIYNILSGDTSLDVYEAAYMQHCRCEYTADVKANIRRGYRLIIGDKQS